MAQGEKAQQQGVDLHRLGHRWDTEERGWRGGREDVTGRESSAAGPRGSLRPLSFLLLGCLALCSSSLRCFPLHPCIPVLLPTVCFLMSCVAMPRRPLDQGASRCHAALCAALDLRGKVRLKVVGRQLAGPLLLQLLGEISQLAHLRNLNKINKTRKP